MQFLNAWLSNFHTVSGSAILVSVPFPLNPLDGTYPTFPSKCMIPLPFVYSVDW